MIKLIIKHVVVFWIMAWAIVCCGGEYTMVSWGEPKSYQSVFSSDTLEIFFKKKDNAYVFTARIINEKRKIPIKNIDQYNNFLNKSRFIGNSVFSRDNQGAFVLFGSNNPSYKYQIVCENDQKIKEAFYIKKIRFTGVTEPLLDMPECSVTLGSDSVELDFNNDAGHNNRNEIFPHQTIIDPEHVKAIRNCIELGKIFVINAQGSTHTGIKETPYKVLGYKNNACIHWDGWWSIRLFWKCVGKDSELSGYEKAEDVKPEEEIKLDLNKDWNLLSGYSRNKRIRDLLGIILIVCAGIHVFKVAPALFK